MNFRDLQAPYYAVIFSYQRSQDLGGYREMDDKTIELAKTMPGYLGHEFAGDGAVHAIFISYWKDMDSINHWKKNTVHKAAKAKGKTQWYQWYHSQITKVEHNAFNTL